MMMRRGRTTQSLMEESRRMFWEVKEWGVEKVAASVGAEMCMPISVGAEDDMMMG